MTKLVAKVAHMILQDWSLDSNDLGGLSNSPQWLNVWFLNHTNNFSLSLLGEVFFFMFQMTLCKKKKVQLIEEIIYNLLKFKKGAYNSLWECI